MYKRPKLSAERSISFSLLGEFQHPVIGCSDFLCQSCALGCLSLKPGFQAGSMPPNLSQQYDQEQ